MTDEAIMTGPMRLEIRRVLNGPIERVWSYLTEPDLRARWFCGGRTDTAPGGRIELAFDHRRLSRVGPPERYADSETVTMSGEILAYEAPTLLKFAWHEIHVDGESVVTIRLREMGDRTELHLVHEHLEPKIQAGVRAGWHAHLDLLVDLLDDRSPRDFWLHFNALETMYEAAAEGDVSSSAPPDRQRA